MSTLNLLPVFSSSNPFPRPLEQLIVASNCSRRYFKSPKPLINGNAVFAGRKPQRRALSVKGVFHVKILPKLMTVSSVSSPPPRASVLRQIELLWLIRLFPIPCSLCLLPVQTSPTSCFNDSEHRRNRDDSINVHKHRMSLTHTCSAMIPR